MTVDVQTCLKLSEAVYGGSEATTILNELGTDWEQIDLNGDGIHNDYCKNESTGFAAAAYLNKVTNEIVIAYRGTDRNGLGEKGGENLPLTPDALDIFADMQIVTGTLPLLPQQFEHPPLNPGSDAWSFYEQILNEYFKNGDGTYDTSKLTITGHSLGGGLAQLVAAKAWAEYEVVNNTYTFNAPGVLPVTESVLGFPNSANITNYVMMNDIIGNFGDHVGDTYYIMPTSDSTLELATLSPHGDYTKIADTEFNEKLSLNWDFGKALATWLLDENNILDNCASIIASVVATNPSYSFLTVKNSSELKAYLENELDLAVTAINNAGTPPRTLHYTTTNGDYIIGDATSSEFIPLEGSDSNVLGIGGNDTIWGNGGNDLIMGFSGDDEIHGGIGDDTIYAGSLNSTNDGKNDLYGDSGKDYIVGGDGNDYIDGGADNDVLVGGAGNDFLIGGAGDDYLTDGEGVDFLMGGVGNDYYFMNYETGSGQDVIIDWDGKGVVNAGGTVLTGGTLVEGTTNKLTVIEGGFSRLSTLKGA